MTTRRVVAISMAILILCTEVLGVQIVQQPTVNVLAMVKTDADSALKEFMRTSYGGMISSFLQFGISPKDSRSLYDAFDVIIASLQKMQTEENSQYSKVSNNLRKFRGTLEDALSDITRGANLNQQQLEDDLRPNSKRLETEISRTQNDISSVQKQLDELERSQKEANDDASAQTKSLNDLINAIDKALEILQNLQAGGQGNSFIQTNVQSFRQLMSEIKVDLPGLRSYPAKPLVSALIEMTMTGDMENREAVSKVIKLLNKIRSQLSSQLNDLQKSTSDSQTAFKKSRGAQKALKSTYEKKLRQAQKDYDRTTEQVKVVERSLDELKGTQEKLTNNLKDTDSTIKQVKDLHEKVLEDLKKELELVQRAMRELDRNGISRPPK